MERQHNPTNAKERLKPPPYVNTIPPVMSDGIYLLSQLVCHEIAGLPPDGVHKMLEVMTASMQSSVSMTMNSQEMQ